MIRSLLACRKGAVAPMVALAMILLLGAVGVAVDMARAQIVRSRMQSALDAGVLAAGATIHVANLNNTVSRYFYSNFPSNYMGTTVTSLTATASADSNTIDASATGTLPTTFLRVLNIQTINVGVNSQVIRQTKGMELVLAMDNTGSMGLPAGGTQTKLQAAQTATQTLLNELYGVNNDTATNLWVGVVPFSQAVNIGTGNTNWLNIPSPPPNFGPVANTSTGSCTPYPNATVTYSNGPKCTYVIPAPPYVYADNFGMANWQGCVEARTGGADITDDPPTTKPFKPYYYHPNYSYNPQDPHNNWWQHTNTYPSPCTQTCSTGFVSGTCTFTAPCCAANDESCVNPPNCGVPVPYACQTCSQPVQTTCPPPISTTTTYDYSYYGTIGDHQGPNLYCPQPMQPMVAEKSTIMNAVNGMVPVGETDINLGMAWAWRMLSPNWQGQWGGEMNANNLPKAYSDKSSTKVVILLSDGDNNIVAGNYSAYGYTSANGLGIKECTGTDCSAGNTELNNRTQTVCNSMKNNGILIYTIALGQQISATGKDLLQNCSSGPGYYFVSPTTATLNTVFQQIGDSLANLRVSH